MATDAELDLWIYFVHGTAVSRWGDSTSIRDDLGHGDYGTGFYAFEDTNWGRRAASAWARRKAGVLKDRPILIRVKVQRVDYLRFGRADFNDDQLNAAYTTLYPDGRMDMDLIVGPVGRRGADGRRIPDRSLPPQHKFEGAAVSKLLFDGMIEVDE